MAALCIYTVHGMQVAAECAPITRRRVCTVPAHGCRLAAVWRRGRAAGLVCHRTACFGGGIGVTAADVRQERLDGRRPAVRRCNDDQAALQKECYSSS